jgi:hypothetical protein
LALVVRSKAANGRAPGLDSLNQLLLIRQDGRRRSSGRGRDRGDPVHYAFPREHWRCRRTNNPLERILREVRRRTRAVGAFPDGKSAWMLAAARLRHIAGTKWGTRRYLDMNRLADASEAARVRLSEEDFALIKKAAAKLWPNAVFSNSGILLGLEKLAANGTLIGPKKQPRS